MAKRRNLKARKLALAAAKVAAERHCSEIVVLDLRDMSPATDYFVIATGTSDRQMRTVADEICDVAKEQDMQRFGRAGYEQARWILLDFVDVVIHILTPNTETTTTWSCSGETLRDWLLMIEKNVAK